MDERFADLKKIPADPAMRLLAGANAKLATKLPLPASAPVGEVLAGLGARSLRRGPAAPPAAPSARRAGPQRDARNSPAPVRPPR